MFMKKKIATNDERGSWFVPRRKPSSNAIETGKACISLQIASMIPLVAPRSLQSRVHHFSTLFHGLPDDTRTGQPSSGQSKKDNDCSEHFSQFHIIVIMILVERSSYSRSHKGHRSYISRERSVGHYRIIIVSLNFNNT